MRYNTEQTLAEQVFRAAANHKLLIIATFVLIVAVGMIATLLITPKYESSMAILYTRDRVDSQISPTERQVNASQIIISDEEFNSELELIRSSEVIKGAIKDLNLINDQKPKDDTKLSKFRSDIKFGIEKFFGKSSSDLNGTISNVSPDEAFATERLVNRIVSNLSIVPVKKSRVIRVSLTDTDPLRAKKTLEAIYKRYYDLRVKLSDTAKDIAETKAGEVFSDLTANYNERLKSATNNIKKFDSENELSGTEMGTQKELLLKQTMDIQSQLDTSRREILETQQRIGDLKEKVKVQPLEIQTSSVTRYVSALDKMKEELVQLEGQKTQIAQKYQPYVENEERIAKLKASIAEESKNPPTEKSYSLNDVRKKLEAELFTSQNNLVALNERERQLSPLLAKLKNQVSTLNTRSIERDGLEREKKVNEEAYLLYERKQRETEVGQSLGQEKPLNFNLVEPPRTDGEAKNPKPILNLIVLIFVGTIFGFLGAIAVERFTFKNDDNDFIATALQLEERWKIPVLATIPIMCLPEKADSHSLPAEVPIEETVLEKGHVRSKQNPHFRRNLEKQSIVRAVFRFINPFGRKRQQS